VPDLAVLRSGEHNTVFIARDNGTFEPREVKLGVRSQGNLYEVLSGLTAGERVVVSGQFMLDSESQLRDAIQKMLNASGDKTKGVTVSQPSPEVTKTAPTPPPAENTTAVVGMDDSSSLPENARARLTELAGTASEGASALAADDLPLYQKELPVIRQALTAYLASYEHAAHGPLGKFKDALPDRADLKAARRDFAYFSTAVADLVRENHLHHATGLHIFQCPMAPGIGTGRWLQRSGDIKNPFYGSSMLECGEELK
jgi:Cu(I)/Ag(I) efflux system membrane fusion protein